MQVSLASWSHCRASPSIFTAKRSKSSCALNSASAASARINASTSARLRPGAVAAVAAVAAFALDAFDAGAVEAFGRRTSKALAFSRGRCSFRSWSRWSRWSHWSSSSRSQRSLWSSSRGCSGVMQLVACLAALKRLSTSKRPCRSECVEKLEKVAGNSWQPNGWKSEESWLQIPQLLSYTASTCTDKYITYTSPLPIMVVSRSTPPPYPHFHCFGLQAASPHTSSVKARCVWAIERPDKRSVILCM